MQRALRNILMTCALVVVILMTENGTEKLENELITTLFENITTLAQLHQFTHEGAKMARSVCPGTCRRKTTKDSHISRRNVT